MFFVAHFYMWLWSGWKAEIRKFRILTTSQARELTSFQGTQFVISDLIWSVDHVGDFRIWHGVWTVFEMVFGCILWGGTVHGSGQPTHDWLCRILCRIFLLTKIFSESYWIMKDWVTSSEFPLTWPRYQKKHPQQQPLTSFVFLFRSFFKSAKLFWGSKSCAKKKNSFPFRTSKGPSCFAIPYAPSPALHLFHSSAFASPCGFFCRGSEWKPPNHWFSGVNSLFVSFPGGYFVGSLSQSSNEKWPCNGEPLLLEGISPLAKWI